MPQKNKEELYTPIFRKFLSAKLDVNYSLDNIWQCMALPPQVLQCSTPKMIVEYFRMAAYGTENPRESDYPTLLRSNTLLYWKKAMSHYMMMSNSAWDEFSNRGNPTKSKEVNECIKSVMKSEVRKQGVNSAARRALEYKEFSTYLPLLEIMHLTKIKLCKDSLNGFGFYPYWLYNGNWLEEWMIWCI